MNIAPCKGLYTQSLYTQSWRDLYEAAMCEPDLNKMPERIADGRNRTRYASARVVPHVPEQI